MKKYLIVKADTNDADYVTEKSEITDDVLEEIMPVIVLLDSKKGEHNFPTHDQGSYLETYAEEIEEGVITEEQLELFEEFCPSPEYGIHSIESIELIEVANEIRLL